MYGNKYTTTQVFNEVPVSRRERTLTVKLAGGTCTVSTLLDKVTDEWIVSDVINADGAYVIEQHVPIKVTVTGAASYSLR